MALLEIAGLKDDCLSTKKIQLCGKFTALQNDPSMPCDLPRSDDALFGAPFVSPSTYNEEVLSSLGSEEGGGDNAMHLAMLHGTTTLGFRFGDGVMIAVDSRATAGAYIASQTVRKIIDINKYLLGTMAGGAADCAYWERVLARQCRVYELRNKERISVAAASKLLSNILYNWKGYGLSVGTMLAGFDKQNASLFYVDSDGQRFAGELFAVGSGSTYAYAVLDREYKQTLSVSEAEVLAQRAIANATFRDAYSGGICRVCHVSKDGLRMLSETDVTVLHARFAEERAK